LNHQDTKITKIPTRFNSIGSSLITIGIGEMKRIPGSAREDLPNSQELLGVLGGLVVNHFLMVWFDLSPVQRQ
jgi:hypothetical protein